MEYEAVIGLEVHAQLLTESKIFCGCSTRFGSPANTQTCPVCTGMPGVLPVLNRQAVTFLLKAALACHCKVASYSRFARKNYFYPDLPKGYQISQYELPLATGGYIEIDMPEGRKRIGLTRIHLEEDAGKLMHGADVKSEGKSYVDLNRTGVPLLEIVTEPDLRSAEEAREFIQKLRAILLYLEICDGNMEEGSLRCDANISVRPAGSKELGTKSEVKNMNSFRHIQGALKYEMRRQIEVLEAGGKVVQETRLWDADKGITIPMRSKEEAHDYRYFPEPDLVPIEVGQEWLAGVEAELPELPDAKVERFVREYGIPEYDARVLTTSPHLADYYEEAVRHAGQPKVVSNWVMGDILRELKSNGIEIDECPITPAALADLIKLIEEGTISGKIAKTVFDEMYRTGKGPSKIVEEQGLVQITDADELAAVVAEVVEKNPEQVNQYKGGKQQLFGFLVGQVMKATRGKANPKLVNELLKAWLHADEGP